MYLCWRFKTNFSKTIITRMKDLKMYINGQFCESSNGQWINVLNPSTEEVISRQPEGTIEDVNRALDAARAAQKA